MTQGARRVLDNAVDRVFLSRPVYLAGWWVASVVTSLLLRRFGRRLSRP